MSRISPKNVLIGRFNKSKCPDLIRFGRILFAHMGPRFCATTTIHHNDRAVMHASFAMLLFFLLRHSHHQHCDCFYFDFFSLYEVLVAWLLRERSEVCKVCHPQFSNGILLPVNWRVHVFKLPVMIDLVSDEAHTVAKSLLDNAPNYLVGCVIQKRL